MASSRRKHAILFLAFTVALTLHLAFADRPLATDVFTSPCPFLADPPPSGFKRWSNPTTWPNSVIPGVGSAAGGNATVPCNVAVLMDVPVVVLHTLTVRGLLKFEDTPSRPLIQVNVSYVVVEGQLHAGTVLQSFSQLLVFTLLPNPFNRQPLMYSYLPPADPTNPRNLGHKTFAIVGGQVKFYGMPGGTNTPSWTKLSKTAKRNRFQITVEDDVSGWPVNNYIVITSTDYFPEQAEVFKILEVTKAAPSGSLITLASPTRFMHYGDPFGIPDGFGGFVDERAEVALLNRTIVIRGLDEPAPNQFEGGHFIVFMTSTPQTIEGVEFAQMGQQGNLGRYNIHFHVCNNQEKSLVRKNVMHDSKQRCVVVHTTHNLSIVENVAFHTRGHCFVVEEGAETNNTFYRNLGIWTRRVEILIPGVTDPKLTDETDHNPATFWITNAGNNYIGNVAAGSEESGFWIELRGQVRGMTRSIPILNTTSPSNVPIRTFLNNAAHSNRGPGLRTYPSGFRPRSQSNTLSSTPSWQWTPQNSTFEGLHIWKQPYDGVFVHNSDSLIFKGSTFADNRWGVNINQNSAIYIQDSRFVILSNNTGNPWGCADTNWGSSTCGPVSGCTFPLASDKVGRAMGWNNWQNPSFGVISTQESFNLDYRRPHSIQNCTFHNYASSACKINAAFSMALDGEAKDAWIPHSVQALKMSEGGTPFYFPPRFFQWPNNGGIANNRDVSRFYVIWDRDGSVTGGSNGFIVANNSQLLPPASYPACTEQPQWNAYACPDVCYRTVQVSYWEEGFSTYVNSSVPDSKEHGDFSFLIFTRVSDGAKIMSDGNLRSFDSGSGTKRTFVVPLVSEETYVIDVNPPAGNPSFFPANLTIQFRDGGSCAGGITFQVPSSPTAQWNVTRTNKVNWRSCPGSKFPVDAQFGFDCVNATSTFTLSLSGLFTDSVTLVPSTLPPASPCPASRRCGIFASQSAFKYDISGRELRPFSPFALSFATPSYNDSTWPTGQGVIGHVGWQWGAINTWTPAATNSGPTFYFRKRFSLANTACVAGLLLDLLVKDGAQVFINNVEALRVNMPNTTLYVNTRALNGGDWNYDPFYLPVNAASPFSLFEGPNVIAVAASAWPWGNDIFFDMQIAADYSVGCTGSVSQPEVCDGLDNDNDGTVDINPSTGMLLSRPCETGCGTGIETCTDGAFQGCTAPAFRNETCNGIDDNCDGMIDNGLAQLDCPNGTVCWSGSCQAVQPLTTPQVLLPRSTRTWYYYGQGHLVDTFPLWTNASGIPMSLFSTGSAPFSTPNAADNTTKTNVSYLTNGDTTYMFLRNFSLTADEVTNTWAVNYNVRRARGVVVYMNGDEAYRQNMPNGTVDGDTFSLDSWGTALTQYYTSPPLRSLVGTLRSGRNWVAAEVHRCQYCSDIFFDLEIVRHVIQPCSAILQSSIGRSTLDSDSGSGFTAAVAAGGQSGGSNLPPSTLPLGMRSSSNIGGRVRKWTKKPVLAGSVTASPPPSFPPPSPSPSPRPPPPPPSSSPTPSPPPPPSSSPTPSPPPPVSWSPIGAAAPSECVRYPPMDRTFIPLNSVWSYIDANSTLPASNWMKPSYDDSTWLKGKAPISTISWFRNTPLALWPAQSPSLAYYFRTTFDASDAECYFNISARFYVNDGAVFYLNGHQVQRFNMPALTPITATTAAGVWSPWNWYTWQGTGGWIKNGTNVLAVEVHQYGKASTSIVLELQLTAQREATRCAAPNL